MSNMIIEKNNQIERIRGILILMIMFYHFTYRFNQLFDIKTIDFFTLDYWGAIGVGCFFIISGYFLVSRNLENYNFKKFIKRKISRIYPAYVLCVSLTFLSICIWGLKGRESSFIDYLLNISMLNGFIGTRYVDAAHWYLTYLIIFYFVIGIILKFKIKSFIYLPMWLFLKDILKFIIRFVPDISIIYKFIGGDWVEFIIIGLAIKEIFKISNSEKLKCFNLKILLYLTIFISIFQVGMFNGMITMFGILVFLLIFLLALKYPKINTKHSILYFIGSRSYIIYLIHQNIGYQIILGLCKSNGYFKFIYLAFTFAIILIFSYLIDKLLKKYV